MAEKIYERLVDHIHSNFSGCENRIIGSEEYSRSAVLVPFVEINGVESILFEKRAQNIRQGGEICFPGGRVDDEDETTIETVIRETMEETGISRESISVHESAGYLLTRVGAFLDVYLGSIDVNSIDAFNPNPDEVDRLFTAPVSFFIDNEPEFYNYRLTAKPWFINDEGERIDLFPAEKLGLPQKYWDPWHNDKNRFVVYHYDGEVIWGITAQILYTVSRLLRRASKKTL